MSTVNLTRELVFNFKKLKLSDFPQAVQDSEEFKATYSIIKEGEGENAKYFAKRNTVKVTQHFPDFVTQVPEEEQETLITLIESAVQSYVKDVFVDQFKDTPPLDWKAFKTWLHSRGSRTKWEFSDAQLEAACESIGAYVAQSTGHAEVGERFAKTARQKFSQASIKAQLNNFESDLIKRIQARVSDWSAWLVQNDEENAEELAPVIECWKSALERHLTSLEEALDVGNFI